VIISAFRRLRHEDHDYEASLGYTARPGFQNKDKEEKKEKEEKEEQEEKEKEDKDKEEEEKRRRRKSSHPPHTSSEKKESNEGWNNRLRLESHVCPEGCTEFRCGNKKKEGTPVEEALEKAQRWTERACFAGQKAPFRPLSGTRGQGSQVLS
jgi:hypothetical protein